MRTRWRVFVGTTAIAVGVWGWLTLTAHSQGTDGDGLTPSLVVQDDLGLKCFFESLQQESLQSEIEERLANNYKIRWIGFQIASTNGETSKEYHGAIGLKRTTWSGLKFDYTWNSASGMTPTVPPDEFEYREVTPHDPGGTVILIQDQLCFDFVVKVATDQPEELFYPLGSKDLVKIWTEKLSPPSGIITVSCFLQYSDGDNTQTLRAWATYSGGQWSEIAIDG